MGRSVLFSLSLFLFVSFPFHFFLASCYPASVRPIPPEETERNERLEDEVTTASACSRGAATSPRRESKREFKREFKPSREDSNREFLRRDFIGRGFDNGLMGYVLTG